MTDQDTKLHRAKQQKSPKQHLKGTGGLKTSALPSKTVTFTISGCNQLTQNRETFVSTGDGPHFYLNKAVDSELIGWCMIELKLRCEQSTVTPKIHLDYGNGMNEGDVVFLRETKKDVYSALFFFESTATQLRLHVLESAGEFQYYGFKIRKLHESEALIRYALTQRKRAGFILNTARKLKYRIQQVGVKKTASEIRSRLRSKQANDARHSESTETTYEAYVEAEARFYRENEESLTTSLSNFKHKPLISIIMPVYNTPTRYLKAAIESVLSQTYPRWELCIADDASTNSALRDTLKAYEVLDKRIKLVFRENNGNISAASNSALAIASGEHIALMDHDDCLSPHALFYVVDALNNNPDAGLFYSDEDKIDAAGNRVDPHFKSAWNPELLFAQNYISHLSVFKSNLIKRAGGFREGFEGSQDFDLVLRCTKLLSDEQIIHIPRVLYHWRAVAGSTALAASEKSYCTSAGVRALEDYFSDSPGVVIKEGPRPTTYRVQREHPNEAPKVSLIIPTRDGYRLLKNGINSILEKTTYQNYEIIIVNNQSSDPQTLSLLDSYKNSERVRVVNFDHPFNFSAINNFAAQLSDADMLGLVNDDIEVISPDWLSEMVSHAQRPEIGAVGAKLLYPNKHIQHAGVILGLGGVAGHSHKNSPHDSHGYFGRLELPQNLSAVTAACLLVRKSVFDEVGGLNATDLAVAFNDIDFCLRIREAGYKNLWTPHALLFHHESVSRGIEDTEPKRERFRREVDYMKTRWGNQLRQDPYYNPNLTLEKEDFSLHIAHPLGPQPTPGRTPR